jgi:hypothetical protein
MTGWASLGLSVFSALAEAGKVWIGIFLGAAGVLGLVAGASALGALVRGRSMAAVGFAIVGLGLAGGLLFAAVYWGLAEYNR